MATKKKTTAPLTRPPGMQQMGPTVYAQVRQALAELDGSALAPQDS